jgi:hypothetical protein
VCKIKLHKKNWVLDSYYLIRHLKIVLLQIHKTLLYSNLYDFDYVKSNI